MGSADVPPLLFLRHGATAPNLAGLRCGGDLDPPLAEAGVRQVEAAARQVAALPVRPGLVVCSDLQRTRETARIVAAALGGTEVRIEPAFAERRLGAWNLRPIALTQPWLEQRRTPPGGESDAGFTARIVAALQRLAPLLPRGVLLVGSKGVARVLGERLGVPGRLDVGNAALVRFDLAAFAADPDPLNLPRPQTCLETP